MKRCKLFTFFFMCLLYMVTSAQVTTIMIPIVHNNLNPIRETNLAKDITQPYDEGKNKLNEPFKKIIVVRSVYPNPFTSSVTIPFTLYEKTLVNIIVYDILGREVKTILNEVMEAGEYRKEADLAMLQKGLYLLKVKTEEQTNTQKITCVK